MADAEKKDHYTITVQVTHTSFVETMKGSTVSREKVVEREVRDVANFDIRSGSIASAIVKASKHLELVED